MAKAKAGADMTSIGLDLAKIRVNLAKAIKVSELRKARIDELERILKDTVNRNTVDLERLREQLWIEK